MTLSDRLQTKLDSARAERAAATAKPNPRAFTRLHAIGLGLGLLMGGGAFLHGAQTPSNTLPPTPVIVADSLPSISPVDKELQDFTKGMGGNEAQEVNRNFIHYIRNRGFSEEKALCHAKHDAIVQPWKYSRAEQRPTLDEAKKVSEDYMKANNNCEPADMTMADLVPATPAKCNPYASDGTYLPELCGDHDAFADRAARTSRVPATTDAERVKAQSLSYAAEQLLARCDRDWLPSTCAQMRAELAQ